MEPSHRRAVVVASALVALGLSGAALRAEVAALQSQKVVFENSRVRVLDYTSRPNGAVCGVGVHHHPAHLTIVLAPARDRMTVGGKSEVGAMKVGDVYWSDGETHTDVNIGRTDSRVIVVELK